MATDPNDDPIDYVIMDLGSPEAMRQTIGDLITRAAEHHDTVSETVTCVLRQTLVSLIAGMFAEELWHMPPDQAAQYSMAKAEKLVTDSGINVRVLVVLGLLAQANVDSHEGRGLPQYMIDAQRAGRVK